MDAQLFGALASEAERRVGNFKPQGLTNTAGAFTTLGQVDAQLCIALVREAEWRLGGFNLPDVIAYSALISACEKSKHLEQALELFEAMR